MPYIVSLKKCSSYDQDEVDKSLRKVLANLGGMGKFIKKNQRILLKPNIVKGMKPEECATTHPAIVEAVVKILNEYECNVFVGDSYGFSNYVRNMLAGKRPFVDDTIQAMKICGIYDVCKKYNAKIVAFDKKIKVISRNGVAVKEFHLTHHFNEIDVIINLPKLKTHSQLYFTGAVKNLYGMMPGPRRGFYHLKYSNIECFANMLLDLYSLLRKKVVLNIMDGVYGMEGNGPCKGNSKFAGILAASSDAIALDFAMCSLIGLNVRNLPTAHYAKKRRDYLFDKNKIRIVGEKTDKITIEPFKEAERCTLNMMPKFINDFKHYILKHENELNY